ncbi:MAG TPA: TonB-dependent receptor [Phenylobacterium sp.]
MAGVASGLLLSWCSSAIAQEPVAIDVPAGTLAAALDKLAAQTHQQVLYPSELVAGRQTGALRGAFTPQEALSRLLVGSDIEVTRTQEGVLVLRRAQPAPASPSTPPAREIDSSARSVPPESGRVGLESSSSSVDAAASAPELIAEVTVIGSLIRGVTDTPSPVLILDRTQIERSGYTTVAAALAALPQNFAGSVNEGLNNNGGERQGSNSHFGSGLNLRGLGSDATLVLVNGRRMGGAGSNAEFADISTIPTAAIERVELLLDGASALYGADAVGGVVNIILKKRFEGAETRLSSGIATAGEPSEFQFAQTFGRSWSGGGGLISYEYYQRDRLRSADREIATDADLRRLGGSDQRSNFAYPGNILRLDPVTGANAPYWAIPVDQDGTSLGPDDFTPGTVNLRNQRLGVDVLPHQERHSLYATARQALTERIELSGDVRYGRRKYEAASSTNTGLISVSRANPFFVSPNGAASHSIQYAFAELPNARAAGLAESLGISLGLDADLWGDWRAEVYGAYAREIGRSNNTGLLNTIAVGEALGLSPDRPDTPYSPALDGYFNPFTGRPANSDVVLGYIGGGYQKIRNRGVVRSLNIKADGSLLTLPAGSIKLALGAQHREEGFTRGGVNYTTSVAPIPLASVDVARKVDAGFAELRIPLFDEANRRSGMERLELSLAGRLERYSDFGWTGNPKVGALWSPVQGLLIRASYGRSFRAPALRELSDPASNSSSLLPSGAARIGTLIQSGGNPDLDPETADSYTVGFELAPRRLSGLRLGFNWFDIRFKDRIDRPVQANIQTALDDANVSTFVRRISPATNAADRALIAALLADPATRTVLGPPEAYGAIVDSRYVNTASLRVSGIDLSAAYEHAFGDDVVAISGAASHLYRYEQTVTPTSAPVDLVGIATYPLDWRARGTLDWRRGALGAGASVNYTSAYQDALGAPIDAMTTFDLQLRFQAPSGSPLAGLSATLNIRNLFDKRPPFYDNTSGVAYDTANGDPIGRFMSLQLTKAW